VDNSKVIAQRAANQDCTVLWAEYNAIPHCFPFIFNVPQKDHMRFERWARFCYKCVEHSGSLRSEGTRVDTSMEVRSVDMSNLTDLSFEEMKERMRQNMQKAERYQEKRSVEQKL